MTENEAINVLKMVEAYGCLVIESKVMAIQALEEIQQYRAMEEKLNGISVAQVVGGFINTIEKGTAEEYMRGRILTNRETDMWDEYRAIGTVEEFKALKDAEEQGLLLRLPCKVGDKVWAITTPANYSLGAYSEVPLKHPQQKKIQSITIARYGVLYHVKDRTYSDKDFGKTVFLTIEEAEQMKAGAE